MDSMCPQALALHCIMTRGRCPGQVHDWRRPLEVHQEAGGVPSTAQREYPCWYISNRTMIPGCDQNYRTTSGEDIGCLVDPRPMGCQEYVLAWS